MTGRERPPGCAAVVCLALVAAAGCSRQPPDGALDRASASGTVHGCWALEVTAEGATRDSVSRWLSAGSLPTVLELDTARVSEGPAGEPVYRARSYFDGRPEEGPFSAWRRISGDSLLVERPGAMTGVSLRLVGDGTALEGVVTAFTDVMEPGRRSRQQAPVRAEPAVCPEDDSSPGA